MTTKTIAETILSQLGGNAFIAMTGAKKFFTNGNDCCFSIGRNTSKANRVQIILKADDTYTVQFKKFTGGRLNKRTYEYIPEKVETLKEYNGVYCDELQSVFTAYTGLYTHL